MTTHRISDPHPNNQQSVAQSDAAGRTRAGDRALILGGGGSTGNAWLIGVIAGFFDAGLDLTGANLIVGTSAGSTAAAQITGASPAALFADIVTAASAAAPAAAPAPTSRGGDDRPGRPAAGQLDRLRAIIATSDGVADMRRSIGAAALDLDEAADGSWQRRWRATVAARLPSPRWPQQTVLITAVDARTGEPVVFDSASGVDLVDAVAASCSNGFGIPPYAIGVGRYIDGGYRRSAENADLATGFDRVLVLSPFGGRSLHPPEWRTHLAAQVDELRADGSNVRIIVPDPAAEQLFGANAMDLSLRPVAARAGYDQASALVGPLAEFWR